MPNFSNHGYAMKTNLINKDEYIIVALHNNMQFCWSMGSLAAQEAYGVHFYSLQLWSHVYMLKCLCEKGIKMLSLVIAYLLLFILFHDGANYHNKKTELSRHDIETRLGVNHSVVNRLVHERQVHTMIEHDLFVPDIV